MPAFLSNVSACNMSDRWSRKIALASKLQKASEAKLRRSEPCAEDHQSAREGSSELLMAEPTSQPDVSDDEMLPWDDDDNSPDECFAFSPHESKAVLHDWLSTQDSKHCEDAGNHCDGCTKAQSWCSENEQEYI